MDDGMKAAVLDLGWLTEPKMADGDPAYDAAEDAGELEQCPLCTNPDCRSCKFCNNWHCSCEERSRRNSASGREGASSQGPSSSVGGQSSREDGLLGESNPPKLEVDRSESRAEAPTGQPTVTLLWPSRQPVSGETLRWEIYHLTQERDEARKTIEDSATSTDQPTVSAMLDEARTWEWLGLPPAATDADVVSQLGKLASALQVALRTSKRRGLERDEAQRELCHVLARVAFTEGGPHDHAVSRWGLARADVLFPGSVPALPKTPTRGASGEAKRGSGVEAPATALADAGESPALFPGETPFAESVLDPEPTYAIQDMHEEGEPDDRGDLDDR